MYTYNFGQWWFILVNFGWQWLIIANHRLILILLLEITSMENHGEGCRISLIFLKPQYIHLMLHNQLQVFLVNLLLLSVFARKVTVLARFQTVISRQKMVHQGAKIRSRSSLGSEWPVTRKKPVLSRFIGDLLVICWEFAGNLLGIYWWFIGDSYNYITRIGFIGASIYIYITINCKLLREFWGVSSLITDRFLGPFLWL